MRNHCKESQTTPPQSPVPSSASSISSSQSFNQVANQLTVPPHNLSQLFAHTQQQQSQDSAHQNLTLSPTGDNHNKFGTPRSAKLSVDNAPVHIDVGGCIYTSSLETLVKFGDSRLSKMFNGTIPIVLDTLKQHYFIDRDGKSFRYVLNFMRTGHLSLPRNFDDFETLLEEAKYYQLSEMVKQIEAKATMSAAKADHLKTTVAEETDDLINESNLGNIFFKYFNIYFSI